MSEFRHVLGIIWRSPAGPMMLGVIVGGMTCIVAALLVSVGVL